MKFPVGFIGLLLALTLAGCGSTGPTGWQGERPPSTMVAGVAYGSAYDSYLSFADMAYMSEAFGVAMDGAEGASRDWRNPRSGIEGAVVAGEAYLLNVDYARGVRLRAPVGLYTDHDLEPAQGDYRANASMNVRLGPSTNHPIVTTLPGGTVVEAAGQIPGGTWMLVARNEMIIGYMFAGLLERRAGGAVLLAGGATRRPVYCRMFVQSLSLGGGSRDNWDGAACRSLRREWQVEGRRGPGA